MQQQFKITLGDELRAKLDAASERAGRSVAEVIRDRLAKSFQDEERDALTRELAADIVALAREVALDFGQEWHADADAHAALAAAVADQIASYRPKTTSAAVRALLGRGNPDDPPDVVGRTHSRNYRRKKQEEREAARWIQNEGQKILEQSFEKGMKDAKAAIRKGKRNKP